MKIRASINAPVDHWYVRSQDVLLGINYGIAFFTNEKSARDYANKQCLAGSKHIVLGCNEKVIKEVIR